MSNYTQNLQMNDGVTSFDFYKGKINSFIDKISPLTKTINNVTSVFNTYKPIVGAAVSGVTSIPNSISAGMEFSRRLGLNDSLNSLSTMGNQFMSNPEQFELNDTLAAQQHLNNVGKYINTYSGNPLSQEHSNYINRIKDQYNEFQSMFNTEEFENLKQQYIDYNNNQIRKSFVEDVQNSSDYKRTMAIVDSTKDFIDKDSTYMRHLIQPFIPVPEGLSESFTKYKRNRKVNTREGISKTLSSIREVAEIAKKNKSPEALKVLLDMKYDYSVNSFNWS